MIYLSFVLAVLILAFIFESYPERTRRNGHRNFILAVSILLALQSGLRHEAVGADTYAYKLKFKQDSQKTWSELFNKIKIFYSEDVWRYSRGADKDPGYPILEKAVCSVKRNYQIYLLLVAVVFFSALGCFIYRNTRTVLDALIAYLLYLTLFYSFFSITGIRQTLATACALIGYEFFIKQKRLWMFLSLMLLASTLHRSVLAFVPFYFIANLKLKKLHYWLLFVLFPVFLYFSENTFYILGKISGYDQYGHLDSAGSYRFTGILLLFTLTALLRIKHVLKTVQETRPMYNALALVIFLTPLTWVNQNAMRLVQYYSLFIMLIAPRIANTINARRSMVFRQLAVGLCILFLLVYAGLRSLDTKYAFFWQQMELGENYRHYR